jgi:hypothetical protein
VKGLPEGEERRVTALVTEILAEQEQAANGGAPTS